MIGSQRLIIAAKLRSYMEEHGLRVIDLFCGAGGFSEGFYQAGFDVVLGVDNWRPACETHKLNGLGVTLNKDLLKVQLDDVISIKDELERKHGDIDIIIGSPPCTEFSYAKKGGKGDIEKGMLLVRKHLLFVAVFKPRYWLMENVPRLEEVLNTEGSGSRETGWTVPYERLGIPKERYKELSLEGDSLKVPNGALLTASDFGTCENRKRFIAGKFPLSLMDSLMVGPGKDVSLGGLLKRLSDAMDGASDDGLAEDPNYPGHKVERGKVRDYHYDTSLNPMYWEEMRHLKRRHIQYGRMHLPEDLSVPARTVVATANSSSRESLILDTGRTVTYQGRERKVYRQPNVREVACIQGFPLDFQLVANTLNDRYKLVGNAVPCQLSYALAKAISMDAERRIGPGSRAGFGERVRTTIGRQKRNEGRPIMPVPELVVGEAQDIGEVHADFRASPNKRIRRRLLSSKLESDSSVVIFENTTMKDGKVTGGTEWKACIQRGGGKTFSQVFLDEVSVRGAVMSLSESLDSHLMKDLIKDLLGTINEGVTLADEKWDEFPGYDTPCPTSDKAGPVEYRRLPRVTQFQKMFTEDLPDQDDVIGPIDLFDALDSIMLRTVNGHRDLELKSRMVRIGSLTDNGSYPFRDDPRVVPSIVNADVPLITIAAGFLAVHVLRIMYGSDPDRPDTGYWASLKASDDMLVRWCSASARVPA